MRLCLCIHVCQCECLPVHPCVCASVAVSRRLPLFFVCVCVCMCAECSACVPIYILSHALFEFKMWLPAAIKRRKQLETKRAGRGASGQTRHVSDSASVLGEKSYLAALMKGQVERTQEREERETER